ncbi:hypothetical protein RRG08_024200 [Elysia crispata]|uniref:Uncharacterized protein n=1 Tax=Elysia crispata TaxID=231223 RepID=A0AAE1D3H1_9GAST|nr:hypothetical protein RRG08_024200 [Elysia crispata]
MVVNNVVRGVCAESVTELIFFAGRAGRHELTITANSTKSNSVHSLRAPLTAPALCSQLQGALASTGLLALWLAGGGGPRSV